MNWWEELEPKTEMEKRLQAEVERLRAVNAELLAACEAAREYLSDKPYTSAIELKHQIEQALAYARGQPDQPTGPKLPGLE